MSETTEQQVRELAKGYLDKCESLSKSGYKPNSPTVSQALGEFLKYAAPTPSRQFAFAFLRLLDELVQGTPWLEAPYLPSGWVGLPVEDLQVKFISCLVPSTFVMLQAKPNGYPYPVPRGWMWLWLWSYTKINGVSEDSKSVGVPVGVLKPYIESIQTVKEEEGPFRYIEGCGKLKNDPSDPYGPNVVWTADQIFITREFMHLRPATLDELDWRNKRKETNVCP